MSLEIIKMEIIRFSPTFYLQIAAMDGISVVAVVLGLLWGRGVPRKKLLRSVLLLVGAALICFGSEAALEQFGMGWRCTPFNIMMFLCLALFTAMLLRCMNVFRHLENTHWAVQASGRVLLVLLVLILVIKLFWVYAGFRLGSWYDSLEPFNGQMIVCARDVHGGSGAWYYYAHINSIVHGTQFARDGSLYLHGYPRFWS
ncbi:MAG: hypothetical protein K2K53_08975 [Oscillospiraceae bacterium]|nr:hypothetical protein [Oscillospiraceae bacterium]